MPLPRRPWKIVVAGTMWGIAFKGMDPRSDTDVCQGTTYDENWRDIANLIVASPDLFEAAKAVLEKPDDKDALASLRKAYRKAGGK